MRSQEFNAKNMNITKKTVTAGSGFLSGLEITKPTFVVDEAICRRNIARMAEKAHEAGLRFRPHFKTHQSAAIGAWFREEGVTAITVSSVSMARYFASAGWNDITVAFPVNLREIGEINKLASEISINLLVENEISMNFLVKNLAIPAGIYIEVDTGYHRTGVDAFKTRIIDQMMDVLRKNRNLVFKGFLSHSGQTYSARNVDDIHVRHADVLLKTRSLKNHYGGEWPDLEISLGDTPACAVCSDWDSVDEIRPGNFVFYDLMQLSLGVCRVEDIAVRVLCPVVSKQIMRNEVVVYGGAVHLSKELMIGANGKKSFGAVCLPGGGSSAGIGGVGLAAGGVEVAGSSGSACIPGYRFSNAISADTWVAGLSQEHGIIRGSFDEIRAMFPGDLLEIIPVHSCLAADLAGYYVTTDGSRIEKIRRLD